MPGSFSCYPRVCPLFTSPAHCVFLILYGITSVLADTVSRTPIDLRNRRCPAGPARLILSFVSRHLRALQSEFSWCRCTCLCVRGISTVSRFSATPPYLRWPPKTPAASSPKTRSWSPIDELDATHHSIVYRRDTMGLGPDPDFNHFAYIESANEFFQPGVEFDGGGLTPADNVCIYVPPVSNTLIYTGMHLQGRYRSAILEEYLFYLAIFRFENKNTFCFTVWPCPAHFVHQGCQRRFISLEHF